MLQETKWYDEAFVSARQCWSELGREIHKKDNTLIETIARRIAGWMDEAARAYRNSEYYRGLIERCGRAIGDRAYQCKDGSRSEVVLCAKIPEIIEKDYRNI